MVFRMTHFTENRLVFKVHDPAIKFPFDNIVIGPLTDDPSDGPVS
jgi:hypothetical protein